MLKLLPYLAWVVGPCVPAFLGHTNLQSGARIPRVATSFANELSNPLHFGINEEAYPCLFVDKPTGPSPQGESQETTVALSHPTHQALPEDFFEGLDEWAELFFRSKQTPAAQLQPLPATPSELLELAPIEPSCLSTWTRKVPWPSETVSQMSHPTGVGATLPPWEAQHLSEVQHVLSPPTGTFPRIGGGKVNSWLPVDQPTGPYLQGISQEAPSAYLPSGQLGLPEDFSAGFTEWAKPPFTSTGALAEHLQPKPRTLRNLLNLPPTESLGSTASTRNVPGPSAPASQKGHQAVGASLPPETAKRNPKVHDLRSTPRFPFQSFALASSSVYPPEKKKVIPTTGRITKNLEDTPEIQRKQGGKAVGRSSLIGAPAAALDPKIADAHQRDDLRPKHPSEPQSSPLTVFASHQLVVDRLNLEYDEVQKLPLLDGGLIQDLRRKAEQFSDRKQAILWLHTVKMIEDKFNMIPECDGLRVFYVEESGFTEFVRRAFSLSYDQLRHEKDPDATGNPKRKHPSTRRLAAAATRRLQSEKLWFNDRRGAMLLQTILSARSRWLYTDETCRRNFHARVDRVITLRRKFGAYALMINAVIPPDSKFNVKRLKDLQAQAIIFYDSIWSSLESDASGDISGFSNDLFAAAKDTITTKITPKLNQETPISPDEYRAASWRMVFEWLRDCRYTLFKEVTVKMRLTKCFFNQLVNLSALE